MTTTEATSAKIGTGTGLRETFCYLDGALVPLSQAKVGVYDIGLLRGFGVYEAMITRNRKPFMLADHLVRLRNSAKRMEMTVPASDEEIASAIGELADRNAPQGEALIRIILTGGEAIDGIAYNPQTPTFYILVEQFQPLEDHYFQKGCAVATLEHLRQFPEFKSTNYIQAVLLQRKKREEGILEIIYTHDGRVLECTGSNLFIVKGGIIATPQKDVLPGITRKVAIDLAKKEFTLEERDVSIEEFFAADEAFITSSFKDVVPVVSADGKQIGSGAPGPVTKRVMELFEDLTRSY